MTIPRADEGGVTALECVQMSLDAEDLCCMDLAVSLAYMWSSRMKADIGRW